MKRTGPDVTPAEQWALLRWKARHIGAFVEDTTPAERRCGPISWMLRVALAGVVARVLGRR